VGRGRETHNTKDERKRTNGKLLNYREREKKARGESINRPRKACGMTRDSSEKPQQRRAGSDDPQKGGCHVSSWP